MLTRMFGRARTYLALAALTALALVVAPTGPAFAAVDTMTVNMALFGGAPTYRASGFIYGLSQNASTPATSSAFRHSHPAPVPRLIRIENGCLELLG